MKKQFYFIVLFLFGLSSTMLAQNNGDEISAKNAIYISVGSIFVHSSVNLNYDLRIRQSEIGFFKNYYMNFEGGIFNGNNGFAPGSTSNGVLGSIGLIGLTGKKHNHFEIGLGVSLNVETELRNTDPEDNEQKETFVLPDLAIGYRIQRKNGPIFRIGIGFPQGIYLGYGYGF